MHTDTYLSFKGISPSRPCLVPLLDLCFDGSPHHVLPERNGETDHLIIEGGLHGAALDSIKTILPFFDGADFHLQQEKVPFQIALEMLSLGRGHGRVRVETLHRCSNRFT